MMLLQKVNFAILFATILGFFRLPAEKDSYVNYIKRSF
jgi:hypothetical protein